MPRLVTLGTLRQRCQRRADLENDDHIGEDEWNALISEQYGKLQGVVIDTGCRYFEKTETITATGAASYPEPSSMLDPVQVNRVLPGGQRRELTRLHPSEQNSFAGMTGDAYAYTYVGPFSFDDPGQFYFYPNPSSGTYEVRFVPHPFGFEGLSDGDNIDVISADGEAAMIWGVAVLARSKSESNVDLAMQREADALARLQLWAARMAVGDGRRPTSQVRMGDIPAIDEGSRWPR